MKKLKQYFNSRKYFLFFNLFLVFNLSIDTYCSANIYYVTHDSTVGGTEFINAITQANAHPFRDSIYFNIPGGGPFNIMISTSVPEITDALLINGFSQPGNDTSNWLIRIYFPYTLWLKSNCEIKGMRFKEQNNNSHITIQIKNRKAGSIYYSYDSVVFRQNYLEQYNLVQREYISNISGGTAFVHKVRIEENFTDGSYFDIWMNRYSNIGIDTLYVLNNQFNPGGFSISGQDSSLTQAIFIRNNKILNRGFTLTGRHHNVWFQDNKVVYNDQIEVSISSDSIDISNNDFSGGCSLGMNNQASTDISRFYIYNNVFHDNTLPAIGFSSYDAPGSSYLHRLSIFNNIFINNPGIEINADGLTRCTITGNTMTWDTTANNPNFVNIYFFGGSVGNSMDSIVVSNNYLDGGGIEMFHSQIQQAVTVRKIHFSHNTIKNNYFQPAIIYNFCEGNTTGIYIDSNEISNCFGGISVIGIEAYLSLNISDVNIRGNTINNSVESGIYIWNQGYYEGNMLFSDFNVLNNTITNNGGNGIDLITQFTRVPFHSSFKNINVSGNIISGNSGNGILFSDNGPDTSGFANSAIEEVHYTQNSIYSNGLKGIEIINNGDPDQLASPIFYFPTLLSVLDTLGSLQISGQLHAEPGTPYRIEFFKNTEKDSSGYGEGETYIGSLDINIDGSGFCQFTFPYSGIADSGFYSSTATNLVTFNTSVFSNDVSLFDDDTTATPALISTLYPNPVSSLCSINISQFENLKSWNVYSVDGKLISIPSVIEENNLVLNFGNIPAALYILVIKKENNHLICYKIIKQ